MGALGSDVDEIGWDDAVVVVFWILLSTLGDMSMCSVTWIFVGIERGDV